eukprot:g11439.t1
MDLARANTGLPALKRQFPHLEEDALALFLETAEGACLSNESLAALMDSQLKLTWPPADPSQEMEKDVAAGKEDQFGHLPTRGCKVQRNEASTLEVLFEGGDSPPHVGTVLHISGLERPDTKAPWAGIVLPTGEVLALQVCQDGPTSFLLEDFGMHELRLCTGSAVERSWFMVSSPLGEYGEALDLFNDAYDWVWDGSWNNELEESVLNLLVALDDAFQPSASGGVSISDMTLAACNSALGSAMRDDYYELLGIRSSATAKEIGRAFRKASLKLHPDKVRGGPCETQEAEESFAAVREAYDTLSDPVARDRYDQRARWMSSHPDQIRPAASAPIQYLGLGLQRAATADAFKRRYLLRPSSTSSTSSQRARRRPSTSSTGQAPGLLQNTTLKDFLRQWPREKPSYFNPWTIKSDFPAPLIDGRRKM